MGLLFRIGGSDGTRVRVIRRDRLRKWIGLPPDIAPSVGDLLAHNESRRRVGWLVGLAAENLDAERTVLRPAQPNPSFREAQSRAFDGTAINTQYWGAREQRALVLHEFRDVMVASSGSVLSIFRGTTVDDRSVGVVREIRRIRPERVRALDTLALCDDHFMPLNPCHAIVDRMTRAVLFRAHGVAEGDIGFVFGASTFGPYARDRVVPAARALEPGTVYRVRRLLVLSTTFTPQHGHPFWYGDPEILGAIVAPLVGDLPPARPTRRLYLARTDARRRPLLDERALIGRLEAAGFESVVMGTLSPREQLALCRSAAVIVAPHGAALMNAVAAPPGTRIVELFNPAAGSAVYAIVSRLLGHDYAPLFGAPALDERAPEGAWRIDPDAVLDAAAAARR